jgi:hypothetical protein
MYTVIITDKGPSKQTRRLLAAPLGRTATREEVLSAVTE